MKKISIFLFSILFSVAAWAANGIIQTRTYTICPGDELSFNGGRQVINTDTVVYDTISVSDPTKDSIYVYIINLYPAYSLTESRELEAGGSFLWHGQTITRPGQYKDVHKSQYGCDSTYHLTVTEVRPEYAFYSVTDTTICQGESLLWNGTIYTSSDTVYKKKENAADGRDSIYILYLNIQPLYRATESVEFNNFPASYRNIEIPAPGKYDFRYTDRNGCDSIITVMVNRQTIISEEYKTICYGDSYTWRGNNYSEAGQYQQTVKNSVGTHDSIYYRLILTVRQIPITRITQTICQGNSYTFGDQTYTQPGTYTHTFLSNGCDSVVELSLNVLPVDTIIQMHEMSEGDTYTWNGQEYTQAGVYYFRTTNSIGCDSVVSLVLTTKHINQIDTTAYICQGQSLVWHGINGKQTHTYTNIEQDEEGNLTIYTLNLIVVSNSHTYETVEFTSFPVTYRDSLIARPGTYDFNYTSPAGCDSIVTVVVNQQALIYEEKATICAGEYYEWRYNRYSETGRYQEIIKSQDGSRDSIYYRLDLTVKYIAPTRVTHTICRGDSYTFGGKTYFESGTYTHIFQHDGCDSVVTLSLTVLDRDTVIKLHQMAEGDTYEWHGTTYSEAGVYDEVLTNRFGCDSVSRLIITTHHVDTIDSTAVICQGEVLVWHGITARETHDYINVETMPNGDQVLYRLHLTVKDLIEKELSFTICQGETVNYNGHEYSQAGTYYDRYSCDTIYRINILLNPVQIYITYAQFDGVTPYTWVYTHDGVQETESFSAPGTYNRYYDNPQTGCKDTYRLVLTQDITSYHFEEAYTICEGEDFTWRGRENLSRQGIGTTTDYYDNFKTVSGNDSIYHLALTVLPAPRSSRTITFCDQTVFEGITYTESAIIYDTVASLTNGCDSIIRIYLDKAPKYLFHDTATIVQGEILYWYDLQINTDGLYRKTFTTVNGCDSIYELGVGLAQATPQTNLYTTQFSICQGDVYTWRNKNYEVSGTYVDSVFAANDQEKDSIFVLNLTVYPTYNDTIIQHLYSCGDDGIIRYNGIEYNTDQTVITHFRTAHNCDSIVKVFLHFNTAQFHSDTLRIADNDTTRFWHERKINHAGTYRYEERDIITGCYNREELVVFMYQTFLYEKDTAICQNEAPYYWLDGPQDKLSVAYSHTPGETKTYEYTYQTVNGVDSIYRLNLTIYPVYISRQQISLCEGESQIINGKTYFNLKTDSIYRDTIINRTVNSCDSVIYIEVFQQPVKRHVETQILHEGETINWNGMEITQGGTYQVKVPQTSGCDSISELHVIAEFANVATICVLDTPYTWQGKDYFTTGHWIDTTYDQSGQITAFRTLDLTVNNPVDTTIFLHGCLPAGVTFNDKIYLNDTITKDTVLCDTIYTLHIKMDTTYNIVLQDTICERDLPYILGRQEPDTIWAEGTYVHKDTTACGCDSTVNLRLFIIPSLTKNDSIIVCEREILESPIILGDTITPWFDTKEGGKYHGKWEGKWHGVSYQRDTIVWDCDSTYFFHIIVKPQEFKDSVYYLCEGDSVQFGWPTPQWIKTEGFFYDTLQSHSAFTDQVHGTVYQPNNFYCDSITRLEIRFKHPLYKDTTAYIPQGDSIFWGGAYRFYTGDYDSIGNAIDIDSQGEFCKLIYTLHLNVEPTYHFTDTIDICDDINKSLVFTWPTGHKQTYNTPAGDQSLHYFDSLVTVPYRFDSIYDLYVNFKAVAHTNLSATICEGDSMRFGLTKLNQPRYLKQAAVYYDTLVSHTNGCDSIIQLTLNVYPVYRNFNNVDIADVDTPYIWHHVLINNGVKDTLKTDSLRASGEYSFRYPTTFGCDSLDSISLRIHKTYLFKDTVRICQSETPHSWHDIQDIYDSGTYTKHYQTTDGYDSTYMHTVFVIPVKYDTLTATICQGDSMRFGLSKAGIPRFLSQIGTYNDTLTSAQGCDSIVTLHLNVAPKYLNHQLVDIADVDTPYIWHHVLNRNGVRDTLKTDSLRASGEYSFHFPTTFGCDSVDSISLRIHTTYIFRDTISICQSQTPYTWFDRQDIYNSGTYTKHYQTADGYDSTYIRTIYVLPVKFDTITATICEGDSMRFGLTKLNQPRFLFDIGSYNDTLTTAQGCDSIITLHLNVYPRFINHQKIDIADVDTPYIWHHIITHGIVKDTLQSDTLRAQGEYSYHFKTTFGCDSIDSLSLKIHNTYLFSDSVYICKNQTPYTWYGEDGSIYKNDIYESGTYYKHLQTHDGYDSTYIRLVYIHPVVYDTLRVSTCETGLPYYFNGQTINQSGTYTDTLTTVNGCDSIVSLILTINKAYYHQERVDIYEGQSYNFFGQVCTQSNTYTHHNLTPAGCDSTTVLQLVVHPMVDTVVTVCSNDLPYIWVNKWNGQTTPLYAAGLYRNDTTYVNGERMFYGLQLNVNNPIFDTIRYSMCDGSSFTFGGKPYTASGTYQDTLTAHNGCDSIVTLILKVNKPFYHVEKVDILEGQSFRFYGVDYNQTGTYPHYSSTPEGCDSTTILQLTVHQMVDTVVTVCSYDLPYAWVNRWTGETTLLYSAGIYRNDTTYVNGEKMYYGLQLMVNQPVFDTVRYAMCEGSTYRFGGKPYTASGTYQDTLTAHNGCDSIVTLILKVNKPFYHVEKVDILEGQSFSFYGVDYNQTGTYPHYSSTPEGCDSTTILQLTVHQMVDTVVTVCSYDLPYAWVNRWTGETTLLYSAGIYRNDTTYVNGEKMYYGLQLMVNQQSDTIIYRSICEGSSYNFNGTQLDKAGEYYLTLQNSQGCDSIVRLHLTILPQYHHIVNRSIFEGDTVMFMGQVFNTAGSYPFRFISSFGCDSVVELNLVVNKIYDDSVAVCYSDLPFVWHEKNIYKSGIYRDTIVDAAGKYIYSGIKVNVLPVARKEEPILVSICEGDYYRFNDQLLTVQGVYYDTLIAVNGCDSIVTLNLQVIPQVVQTETKIITEGQSVMFYGEEKTTSGVYEHVVTNEFNCLDIYRLVLTVIKEYHKDTAVYICDNELPYLWQGLEIHSSGDYDMPTAWTDTTRVVTTLHLHVRPTYYMEKNISLCEGNTFIYKNREYTQSGYFFDTIPSQNGCDSIYKYIISVHPTYDRIDTVHISDKQSYEFNGRIINQSGKYEASFQTEGSGCDSLVHLVLVVHPSYYYYDTIDLCQKDTLYWHGKTITKSGLYSDSLLTKGYGFDSVYQIKVIVHPNYYMEEQYEIIKGQTTYIHGIDISQPGTYKDSLLTRHGCDSIFNIVVNWARIFVQHQEVTICQGDYYDFYGTNLTHSGLYTHVTQTGDSIYLTLTVNPKDITEKEIVITPYDLPYIYQGQIYEQGGLYTETYKNKNGCDSICRLQLTVTNRYSEWDQIALCSGKAINIDGKVITEAGTYTFVKRSEVTQKLDSLYRVEVYEAPDYESKIDSITICEGDTVEFGGKQIWRAGSYTANFKTKHGCDSILHMFLTINESYLYTTDATIAEYQTYTWRDKEYRNAGVYEQSYPTINDCDSTYRLNLAVLPTQRIIENDSICYKDTLRWRNRLVYEPGTYTDTILNMATNTSVIYVLNLSVITPTLISTASVTETAADAESFKINFTYSGLRPSTYSILFDELAHKEGFVDIINKPFRTDVAAEVPMPKSDQVVYKEHTAYVRPNYYTMRLALDNGVCGVSRSDSLTLLVKYPSWIIEQNWTDVVAPLSATYNGGYKFGAYSWYVNDVLFANDGQPYLYTNTLNPGDKVVLHATRIGESYSIPTMPLTIVVPQPDILPTPVLVYPTAVSKQKPSVTLKAEQGGKYKIYSATGDLYSMGEYQAGEQQLELQDVSGCCLIYTISQDGVVSTQKVVVY